MIGSKDLFTGYLDRDLSEGFFNRLSTVDHDRSERFILTGRLDRDLSCPKDLSIDCLDI